MEKRVIKLLSRDYDYNEIAFFTSEIQHAEKVKKNFPLKIKDNASEETCNPVFKEDIQKEETVDISPELSPIKKQALKINPKKEKKEKPPKVKKKKEKPLKKIKKVKEKKVKNYKKKENKKEVKEKKLNTEEKQKQLRAILNKDGFYDEVKPAPITEEDAVKTNGKKMVIIGVSIIGLLVIGALAATWFFFIKS